MVLATLRLSPVIGVPKSTLIASQLFAATFTVISATVIVGLISSKSKKPTIIFTANALTLLFALVAFTINS